MMSTTSNRPMSRSNRRNALIRIQKELQYIADKCEPKSIVERHVRQAIGKVVDAILDDEKPANWGGRRQ